MKAPSTTGIVIALVLVLVSVWLGWRLPQPTHMPSIPSPKEVGTPAPVASATGPLERRRESAAMESAQPSPGKSPAGALSELQMQEVRCGLWRHLYEALDRLSEANELLHLSGGSDAAFRRLLVDYIRDAAALDGVLGGAYEVADRRVVYRAMTDEKPDQGALRGLSVGGVFLLVRTDAASHALHRHAFDPPDAAVFALRRHLIDAFNAMPVASRRKLLEADASARAQLAIPGERDKAALRSLESQLLNGGFRRLMVGWMLAEP